MSAHPIAVWRKAQDLTQADLAKKLGVKRTTIARWETGARKIDQELLSSVSKKTGIPASQLRPDLAKILEPA